MKEGLVLHLSRIPVCAVCAAVPAWGLWNLLECRLSQHKRQLDAWHVAKGMTDTLTHDSQSDEQKALCISVDIPCKTDMDIGSQPLHAMWTTEERHRHAECKSGKRRYEKFT